MSIELTKDQIYDIKSFMAFVLRHKPYFYKIKLDNDGFANVDDVLRAISKNKKINITKEQLSEIVKKYSGGIFLLVDNKVKAKSGHTVTFNMYVPEGFVEATEIPNLLYCVVDKDDISKIISEKGISFSNKKIFLSRKQVTASSTQSSIHVQAQKAKSNLVKFYHHPIDDRFFTHHLSSQFLSIHV